MGNITELAICLYKERCIKECRERYGRLLETIEYELRDQFQAGCTYAELIDGVDNLDNLVKRTLGWSDSQFYIFKLALVQRLEEKQLRQYVSVKRLI